MSAADEDFEHWPADDKNWTEPAVAAPGYDSNNGLQQHSYLPPAPEAPPSEAPQSVPPPQVIYSPIYYSHPPTQRAQPMMTYPQPQYYSHPPQAMYTLPACPAPPQGYYAYGPSQPAAPPPQVVAAPPAPPAPATQAIGANFHIYQPAYSDAKTVPEPANAPGGPPGNVWLGRTKAEVEEDNMKIAKKQGAYDKRKIAPIAKDSDPFWVVELDGDHTLRAFREIKELSGTWKKDPRFEEAYYFVREEEEEAK